MARLQKSIVFWLLLSPFVIVIGLVSVIGRALPADPWPLHSWVIWS